MYKTRDGDVCYEVHEMPSALRARGFHDAAETWELEDERCGVMCACGDFNCSDMMGPYCTFRGSGLSLRFAVRKEPEVTRESLRADADERLRAGQDESRKEMAEWLKRAGIANAGTGVASTSAAPAGAMDGGTKKKRSRAAANRTALVCQANTVTTNKSIAHRCTRRAIAGSDFCKTHGKVATPLVTSSDWDERPEALNDGDDPFDFD